MLSAEFAEHWANLLGKLAKRGEITAEIAGSPQYKRLTCDLMGNARPEGGLPLLRLPNSQPHSRRRTKHRCLCGRWETRQTLPKFLLAHIAHSAVLCLDVSHDWIIAP